MPSRDRSPKSVPDTERSLVSRHRHCSSCDMKDQTDLHLALEEILIAQEATNDLAKIVEHARFAKVKDNYVQCEIQPPVVEKIRQDPKLQKALQEKENLIKELREQVVTYAANLDSLRAQHNSSLEEISRIKREAQEKQKVTVMHQYGTVSMEREHDEVDGGQLVVTGEEWEGSPESVVRMAIIRKGQHLEGGDHHLLKQNKHKSGSSAAETLGSEAVSPSRRKAPLPPTRPSPTNARIHDPPPFYLTVKLMCGSYKRLIVVLDQEGTSKQLSVQPTYSRASTCYAFEVAPALDVASDDAANHLARETTVFHQHGYPSRLLVKRLHSSYGIGGSGTMSIAFIGASVPKQAVEVPNDNRSPSPPNQHRASSPGNVGDVAHVANWEVVSVLSGNRVIALDSNTGEMREFTPSPAPVSHIM